MRCFSLTFSPHTVDVPPLAIQFGLSSALTVATLGLCCFNNQEHGAGSQQVSVRRHSKHMGAASVYGLLLQPLDWPTIIMWTKDNGNDKLYFIYWQVLA